MNFTDLKNEITLVDINHPLFVYVGLGVACNLCNDNIKLEQKNYHQYPPFVQDLYNKIPNLHVFLVLIDPFQENPPRVSVDYNLKPKNNGDEVPSHYSSDDKTLNAFIYREYAHTDIEIYENNNEITNSIEMMRDLNSFIIEKNGSMLFELFTGKSVAPLAEYFDYDKNFLNKTDQIVYGMNMREDHGCSFDLTDLKTYFPFRIEKKENERPIIKMFNYYHIIGMEKKEEMEREKYPIDMHEMIEWQKEQMINNITTKFKNVNIGLLREARNLQVLQQNGEEDKEDKDDKYLVWQLNKLPLTYKTFLSGLIKEKEYELIYDIIYNYIVTELDILSTIKKMDITGEDILKFITEGEDTLKWYNNIKLFL